MIDSYMKIKRFATYTIFTTIEIVGFLLPAFPKTFRRRFFILFLYLVAHKFHLQKKYLQIKTHYLPPLPPPPKPT